MSPDSQLDRGHIFPNLAKMSEKELLNRSAWANPVEEESKSCYWIRQICELHDGICPIFYHWKDEIRYVCFAIKNLGCPGARIAANCGEESVREAMSNLFNQLAGDKGEKMADFGQKIWDHGKGKAAGG
jgi:hypothetical protein